MIHLTRISAMALSILVSAHVFPVPAEAQLGGLARRARAAVEGKAEEKIEDAIPFTPLPAPEFGDRLLEITDARLARMLGAFDAEINYSATAGREYRDRAKAHEDAMRDFEKALEAYDKKNDRYGSCADDFWAGEEEQSTENEARIDKPLEEMNSEEFETYVMDLAERGERIAEETEAGRNDPEFLKRREEYLAESQAMQVEQARRMQQVLAGQAAESRREATADPRLLEACGEAPVRPVQPQSELTGPEGMLVRIGAEAAELTVDQYALMRERILYWSIKDGRPSGMGYSDGEMGTLTERRGTLEHLVERMRKAKIPV